MNMPLPEQENPFETLSIKEFLPTIRDAKHYLNLLSQDIKSYLGKEDFKNLVWSKWYLVELLKHCDSYLYTQLKARLPDGLTHPKSMQELGICSTPARMDRSTR